jgi:hypothetical protein
MVRLRDIAAVFVPADPEAVDLERGLWISADDLVSRALEVIESRIEAASDEDSQHSPTATLLDAPAIVFLPETAQVLMQVEVGLTAAESVEYYPPMPGDRASDFRAFCTSKKH